MAPAFLAVALAASDAFAAALRPVQLHCEHATDPLGVDVSAPRLSWQLQGDGRDRRQTAWQVLAADSRQELNRHRGNLWDSGKVRSDQTLHIPYAGAPLRSSQQVFWKVRVWDERGRVSAWSAPATWTMGLLEPTDWQARWIGSGDTNTQSLLLRRLFEVRPGLRRALVHVCGLGHYELSLNGHKSGDALLVPGWSQYDKTCLYDTHDVTALVRPGANVVGLVLGKGMYHVPGGRYVKFTGSFGPLKAIAHLRLEYADGSVVVLGTDARWRLGASPITFSCVYGGEDYDARLEQPGWDTPGFDATGWAAAVELPGPGGALRGLSAAAPAFRAFEVLKPVSVRAITDGVSLYDLGQNASLMPRVRLRGPAGSVVRLIPAELVNADGTVDRRSVGGGQAWWQCTLDGRGSREWFPRFFYHGARYLQVECRPAQAGGPLPVVEALEGVVVHSDSAPVGDFECSNPLFNRIRRLVRWAQRSNLASVITDCPHRERLGWLEQYHLNGPSLRYEFDLTRLFQKGMNDMADAQLPNGCVPNIAPEYVVFGKDKRDLSNPFRDSPEWGSAVVLVPWQQYLVTGDADLLRRYYDVMCRYVGYLTTRATDHIVSHGLGDWYDIGPNPPGYAQLTPRALTATAFYYADVTTLAEAARLLGRAAEAQQFSLLAARIAEAFNRRFFNPTNHSYATGSQCANAVPLVLGLCVPANRAAVLEAIVRDVRAHGNAMTAGDVGYRYLLRALADGGRSDVVFDMVNQSEKPGYGYQLKMGATSLTEAWDAGRDSSQNHFMLGQIIEWFYGDLAGIAPDPDGPGFSKIIIRPQPVGDVTWARASFESVRGRVAVQWRRDPGRFVLEATVPCNASATVFVPARAAERVRESGRPAGQARGVRFVRCEPDRAVFQIGSGRYEFESDW